MRFLVNEEQANDSGIYIIRNTVNDKVYIGSAVDLRRRYSVHVAELKSSRHHSTRLRNFVGKYGIETLVFELLVSCCPSQLISTEQILLDGFQSYEAAKGFNMCPTAGSTLGKKHGPEARAKMSASRKGIKLPPRSEEATARIAAAHRGMKRSAESRAKMSAAQKEAWARKGSITDAERENRSKAHLGKKMSEEVKAKLKDVWIGRKHRPESIEKMRVANTGKTYAPRSEESKAAMAEKTRLWWEAKRKEDPNYTRRETTHCPQGHEYTEKNTYRAKTSKQCKTCRAAHRKKQEEKKKAEKQQTAHARQAA